MPATDAVEIIEPFVYGLFLSMARAACLAARKTLIELVSICVQNGIYQART